MDTVLFTDDDVLVFAIVASAILLTLVVLLVSTRVEQRVERLESKIRKVMWSDLIQSIRDERAAVFQIDERRAL